MTSELGAIPAPPRAVRWRAALRRRWPLGIIAIASLLVSIVVLAILASTGVAVLPFEDDALDADRAITEATVTAVEPTGMHAGARRFVRVEFRFELAERGAFSGHSFGTERDGFAVGQVHPVQYLPESPEVARLAGTRLNPLGLVWSVFFGLFFLPAIALSMVWLRGAAQLRILLATGRLTLAHVVERRPILWVNPSQWRVTYRFRDDAGGEHSASQWVGQRSPLGERLAGGVENLPVVFDPGEPAQSRLVHRDDFDT